MKAKRLAFEVARALAGVNTMPRKREITLDPNQLKWIGDIVSAGKAVEWTYVGDCSNGWKFVKNDDLGIALTYSHVTKTFGLAVDL